MARNDELPHSKNLIGKTTNQVFLYGERNHIPKSGIWFAIISRLFPYIAVLLVSIVRFLWIRHFYDSKIYQWLNMPFPVSRLV